MTVKELIEHLQTLPEDYLVIYKACSDYTKMNLEDIRVTKAEDKDVVQHHNIPDQVRSYSSIPYLVKRGKLPKEYEPKFLNAVIFPGN